MLDCQDLWTIKKNKRAEWFSTSGMISCFSVSSSIRSSMRRRVRSPIEVIHGSHCLLSSSDSGKGTRQIASHRKNRQRRRRASSWNPRFHVDSLDDRRIFVHTLTGGLRIYLYCSDRIKIGIRCKGSQGREENAPLANTKNLQFFFQYRFVEEKKINYPREVYRFIN